MNKKTVTQVLLIFLIISIPLYFYLKYFDNGSKVKKEILNDKQIALNKNSSSTYINNIDYISFDIRGNKYQITAEQAEIAFDNADIMFLKNVISYIFIKDSDIVKITSDFGKYNSKNYDTIFSKNVIINYPGHKITGEYLDFSFLNNLGTVSKNVVYNWDKKKLFADKVEMNLATKDTKIFMEDINEKGLIEGIK